MTALVFDTETNDSVNAKLIEAAGIILGERDVDPNLINLKPLRTFSDRYNPGAPSTLGALMTHHILDSELVDCPAGRQLQAARLDRVPHRAQRRFRLEGDRRA
jgi:exodeoxyribonuclease X